MLVVSFCEGHYREEQIENLTVLVESFWERQYRKELIVNVTVFVRGSGVAI